MQKKPVIVQMCTENVQDYNYFVLYIFLYIMCLLKFVILWGQHWSVVVLCKFKHINQMIL